MLESVRYFDNFLPFAQLEEIKASALRGGFGTWTPDANSVLGVNAFKGVGYVGNHGIIFKRLHELLGFPLYPNEAPKFRKTDTKADGAYVHSDRSSGELTAILYLSHDNDPRSGTGFYRHRPTQAFIDAVALHQPPLTPDEMPCYFQQNGTKWGDMLQRDMREENPEQTDRWECTGFVRAIFGRMVVFKSSLYHSRLPREGLGTTDADARIIWVSHNIL